MAGLAAGRLRAEVTFEEPIESQDGTTGEVTVFWQAIFESVRAEINERTVREAVGGGQMQETKAVTVTVRWRPGFDARQRIVWATSERTRVFAISGMLPDTETGRTWVEIPVVELL